MPQNGGTYTFTIEPIVNISNIQNNVSKIKKAFEGIKLPDKLGKNLNNEIEKFGKAYERYIKKQAEGIKTPGDLNSFTKVSNEMVNSYRNIANIIKEINNSDLRATFTFDDESINRVQSKLLDLQNAFDNLKFTNASEINKQIAALEKSTRSGFIKTNLQDLKTAINSNDFEGVKVVIQELSGYLDEMGNKIAPNTRAQLEQIATSLKPSISQFDGLNQKISETETELDKVTSGAIEELKQDWLDSAKAADTYTDSIIHTTKEQVNLNKQVSHLEGQVESYFGLNAIFRTVANMAREAMQTVKELDAAMTETAVVTNFKVSDMWNMLPTYTQQANKLGSTIKDVYKATTLYYQQGLNTNQAMGLANETLKMARIAGMDAKDATNAMTAALRGFNLELNQVSAQRINDVYSELAAITASDTQEISAAMEKVASLAHNAGMELETTSAFLAQMIETTREAPENLGTALKTVIARFQEMKQDPTKLIDSEGVAMDANKVDKALKSIGVALTNERGEFRKLDDVFLEIAGKWDTLTMGQQRYIATMAAGSRQQSRFIAMMSNYSRTMELVDAANNSAGASQRQFEKTLDSMEAKLNKFKNAWNRLIMGLMNNEILKFAVDAGTELLTLVNDLIDKVSGLTGPAKGLTKSLLTLGATFGMLSGARSLLYKGIHGTSQWFNDAKNGVTKEKNKSGISTSINQQLNNTQNAQVAQQAGQRTAKSFRQGFESGIQGLAQSIQKGVNNVKIGSRPSWNTLESAFQEIGEEPLKIPVYKAQYDAGELDLEGLKKNRPLLEDSIKKFDQLDDSVIKFNGGIGKGAQTLTLFGQALQGTPLAPFGQILTAIGSALFSLDSLLIPATAETTGLTIANYDLAASFGAVTASLGAILAIALPILAIIGTIVAVVKLLDIAIETNAEKLEAAEKASNTAADAYDSLKQSASELDNTLSELSDAESGFEGLVAGTVAFNEQLSTSNQLIQELLEKYPMLLAYTTTDSNGRMQVSEEGIKQLKKERQEILQQASALSLLESQQLDYEQSRQKAQSLYNKGRFRRDDEATLEADRIMQEAEVKKESAHHNIINGLITNEDLANAQKVADILSKTYEQQETIVEKEISAAKLKNPHQFKEDAANTYAKTYGYTYENGEFKDIDGNIQEIDDATLRDAYLDIKTLERIETNAGSLDNTLSEVDKMFANIIGDKVESNTEIISDLLTGNIETDTKALEELNKTPELLEQLAEQLSDQQLADLLQIDVEQITNKTRKRFNQELIKELSEDAENVIKAQGQIYSDLGTRYIKAQNAERQAAGKTRLTDKNFAKGRRGAGKNSPEVEAAVKAIENKIKNLSSSQVSLIDGIASKLDQNLGPDVTNDFLNKAIDIYSSGNEASILAVDNILQNANWDSAIDRLQTYDQLIKSGNKDAIELGTSMKGAAEETTAFNDAFLEVYSSEDFGEVLKDLDKFKNDAGQIDASGVKAMAEESSTLAKFLELDAVNAAGFARLLEGFNATGLNVIDESTLKLLSTFGQLDAVIQDTHEHIANFNAGIDTGEGEDFAIENYKKIKEYYENNEYGNQELQKRIQEVVGVDAWNRVLKNHEGNLRETEKAFMPLLKQSAEGLYQNWANMADGVDAYGRDVIKSRSETFNKEWEEQGKTAHGIEVGWNKNGSVNLQTNGATTDEVVAWIQKVYHVSEDYAKIMLTDFENYSEDLASELSLNDWNAGIEEFAADHTFNDAIVVTTDQLELLAASTGKAKEDLVKDLEATGQAVKEFSTDDLTLKNYAKTFQGQDVSTWLQRGSAENGKEAGTLDISNAVTDMQRNGIDLAKAQDALYDGIKDEQEVFYNGQKIGLENIHSAEELAAEMARLDEEEPWANAANTFLDNLLSGLETWIGNNKTQPETPSVSSNYGGTASGRGSNTTTSTTKETHSITNVEKTVQTVDNTQAKNKITEVKSEIEQVNKKLAEKRSLGVNVNDREVKVLENRLATLKSQLNDLQNRQVTVNVKAKMPKNLGGSLTGEPAAKGRNNYISSTGFYAGSSARGHSGTIGPKDKGGLTLTGEKGFEIAWLPRENRSMILGVAGPQMLHLPSDVVVWTHEQSKKILKQQSIDAGSMATGYPGKSKKKKKSGGGGSSKSSKKKSSKSKSKSSSKSSSKGEINNFSIEEVIRFNVDQKIATQTAAIEKRTKSIEKSLDKIGTTYGSIASDINKQVAGVKDLKAQNQALVQSYERQLAALDKNYKQKVSWTDSKGNSQEKTVNLGDYIKKVGDSYQIDQAKITKLGSPAEREAVFNAANSALSNLTSGLLNAKKAVDEAEQQLEDFRKQLQDTFYGWENELTKIYNLSQQIESLDLSSDRFSAEIDSTLALVGTQFLSVADAGKRLIEVQKQNASVLTQNIQKQAELIKARRDQLALDIDYADELKAYNNILSTNKAKASKGTLTEQDKIKQNAAYDALVAAQMPTRYATRTRMQDGSYQLDIDWAKLERDRTAGNITDKTYDAIKNGIDKMQESINEYNQSIIDGFNSLQEIAEQYNNYVETLADLEKEVADAIKDMALNQVARLESLNKSIVDAGKKILDQARKNLQNRRQSEDNAKTEADIAKKENRLAALRANTSGGNQVEIAQLQKEINDARQNYGRTLEDQLLSRLQTQSDEAAAQRQEQIDLLKQQIELNSLNGVYFQEADALLTNVDAHSSEIKDILTTTQEETTGKWGAQVWEQELEQKIGNAITAEAGIPQLANVIQSEGSALREALVSANASSTSVSGTQSASTASIASNPVIENKAPASTPKASSTPAKSTPPSSSKYPYGKASDTTGNIKKGNKGTQVKAIQYALKQLHYVNKKGKALAVDGVFGADTQYAVKNFQKKRKIKATGIVNDTTRSKFRAMGYKTGGLADYTGPAWLDGTPSKPEMVLNAQDTKNFIALKDILAGVMHDISHMDSNETYNAPMEFNINVNVEKISNDYDVDKLANRLKKDIVKDMSYRNVTQVRKFR